MSIEPNTIERDQAFMKVCLELAQRAEGRTSPNPIVGAIVVDVNGQIVGRGYHKKHGTPHAEVYALAEAGEKSRGATLYVSLEPCCHFGQTSPCSDLVTSSGVSRVVAAMVDPNPKVAGKGIKQIQDAGIAVTVGVLEAEAEWQNRGFLKRIRKGLPWVCLKMALTLDGRIADRTGSSRWVTNSESRVKVHELRNKFDAVLIGGNTLKADDPELTVRDIADGRNPVRVAIDSRLSTSPSSRFCTTNPNTRTLLFTLQKSIDAATHVYPGHIELLALEADGRQVNITLALQYLAQQGINSVLCEGGGKLAGSLLAAGLIDEIYWVIAPKFIGDVQAIPVLQLESNVSLADAWHLKNLSTELVGSDIWIHGTL
ncbi:MAG: bifunctional diaminohydroxyphosphoribosylaminopyrimidine deaminase/5-amino-6-(5-phosphoribosylamino)uracil reductase RibD [Candidatus Melainabacteria bacterium]|nr:bifunctional diaminohydroxyphosphoribosylaminopyrimidine deaminase/5-amino-6-(5-phosphoribosylamino)uracil reductase RibD [Candidatus Melainabacteria bacterium]